MRFERGTSWMPFVKTAWGFYFDVMAWCVNTEIISCYASVVPSTSTNLRAVKCTLRKGYIRAFRLKTDSITHISNATIKWFAEYLWEWRTFRRGDCREWWDGFYTRYIFCICFRNNEISNLYSNVAVQRTRQNFHTARNLTNLLAPPPPRTPITWSTYILGQ
jgi:hypothetical protein